MTPSTVPKGASTAKGSLFAHLGSDLPASIVVFLVALPLSLGIAQASGAPYMAGIIAAIVGGLIVGSFGGAPLQVSGPAAGLTVIVAGIIQQFGWETTCFVIAGAGLLQIILGFAGVAPVALAMSPAVIHGMLAAIGVLIALSQMHVVLGAEPAGKGIKSLFSLPDSFLAMNPAAAFIGGLTIVLMVLWPKIPNARIRAIPAALCAVGMGTLASLVLKLDIPRVTLNGTLFESLRLPAFPQDNLGGIVAAILTLCFVASAESLLSAVATDKLHTGPRANLHRELIGQGAGNLVSGLIGGLPITGVIVRSTANITSGARTRLSAILHGVWVLVFVMALPGVIKTVPLAALGGLLVYTGGKLVNLHHIRELRQHGELWVYAVTLLAIISTDLLVGLGVGFAVVLFRLLWRLTHVDVSVVRREDAWRVTVHGTLTFAGVPKLISRLSTIPQGEAVEVDLVLRYIDHAGYEALSSWRNTYEKLGGVVRLDHLEDIWSLSNGKLKRQPKQELLTADARA